MSSLLPHPLTSSLTHSLITLFVLVHQETTKEAKIPPKNKVSSQKSLDEGLNKREIENEEDLNSLNPNALETLDEGKSSKGSQKEDLVLVGVKRRDLIERWEKVLRIDPAEKERMLKLGDQWVRRVRPVGKGEKKKEKGKGKDRGRDRARDKGKDKGRDKNRKGGKDESERKRDGNDGAKEIRKEKEKRSEKGKVGRA